MIEAAANSGSGWRWALSRADRLAPDLRPHPPGLRKRHDYRILSFDAGAKYRGIFLQTEVYTRWLDGFGADGPLPVQSVVDKGFYVQGAFYPVPKKLELYAATSQIATLINEVT